MAKNVVHTVRGFHMSAAYAEQVMREHCTITWDVKGVSIRDTTDEERWQLRAEQVKQAATREPLPNAELANVKCEGANAMNRFLVRAAHEFAASAK